MSVLLQVICITYNQETFVRQTLESFIMQKTTFEFEVLIADDASTDSTPLIIQEFQKKYPNIIKPTFRSKNLGPMRNSIELMKTITAPYVAMCEGDDYWTDSEKLQKQVNILDENHDYSICFHPVKVIWEDNLNSEHVFPCSEARFNKKILTLKELGCHNFIQTNSVVYRWGLKKESIDEHFPADMLPGDYFLHLLHAEKGNIFFLDECMAVYRKWSGGVWAGAGITDEWFLDKALLHLRFYKYKIQKIHTSTRQKIRDLEQMFSMRKKLFEVAREYDRQDIIEAVFREFSYSKYHFLLIGFIASAFFKLRYKLKSWLKDM